MARKTEDQLNLKQGLAATCWFILLVLGLLIFEHRINRWLGYSLLLLWVFFLKHLLYSFRTAKSPDSLNQRDA